MEVFIIIVCAVLLLVGLIGCILPALPGPPIAYIGLALLHFTTSYHLTTHQLLWGLGLVIVVQILDYVVSILGVKRLGGSDWGVRGSIAGTLVGIFVFPPWGILFGPLIGAIVGELLGGNSAGQSIRAGLGAFAGFVMGTLLKFILCGWFIYLFFRVLFW